MFESFQRGNVTIITAFTALLMMMIIVLGTSIGNQSSNATRMQASSDTAAIAAAESYIAIINDEVAFDIIDWGLGFVQRLAQLLEYVGRAIQLIPYVGAVIGGVIVAIAQVIQNIAKRAQDVFKKIKDKLNDVLEKAKQILATINATLAAASNGYLGFILPTGFLNQAALSQYTLKDVQDYVKLSLQINDAGELHDLLFWNALHTIWDSGRCSLTNKDASKTCSGNFNNGDPNVDCNGGKITCKNDGTRLGATRPNNQEDINRDTFHLQDNPIPGCVNPSNPWTDPQKEQPAETNPQAWSHSCDEKQWFVELVQTTYFNDIQALVGLRSQINFDQKNSDGTANQNPVRFSGSDTDKQTAKKALDDAIQKLSDVSTGSGAGSIKDQTTGYETKIDAYAPGKSGPFQHCAMTSSGNFNVNDPNIGLRGGRWGFKCNNQYNYDPVAKCKAFTPPPPAQGQPPPPPATPDQTYPCLNYWGMPDNLVKAIPGSISDPQYHFTKAQGFPDPAPPQDYRDTSFYADEVLPPDSPVVDGARVSRVAQWQASLKNLKPSVSTADQPTKDVVQDFIQVAQVRPFYPEQLAYRIAGKGDPPTRYSINASKAIVHRADSKNDRVLAADICDNITDKGTQGKDYSSLTRVSAPLSFLPDTIYGWCVLILGFFDTLYDIYTAISDFFHKYLIDPLRSFSFTIFGVHICPFCWLADIVQGLLDYLLGPAPPDTRTWHIALVSIACIPAIGYIAKIAGVIDKGIGDIGDIINDIENLQKPGGTGKPAIDENDSTCNGADNKNSGGEPGSP